MMIPYRSIMSMAIPNLMAQNLMAPNLMTQRSPNHNAQAALELQRTPDASPNMSIAGSIAAHGRAWICMPRPDKQMAR